MTQIDTDAAPDHALYAACHNSMLFGLELIVDNLPLLLADALEDHVLRLLCGDTAK